RHHRARTVKFIRVILIPACYAGAWLVRGQGVGVVAYLVAIGCVAAGIWQAFEFVAAWEEGGRGVVLRLWGLTWTRDEACCHFFITGATGTGKTARAVVPIVHGLRSTLPDTGILAVDSKGALWQPLSTMARSLGQEETLRLIRVRPTHVPPDRW